MLGIGKEKWRLWVGMVIVQDIVHVFAVSYFFPDESGASPRPVTVSLFLSTLP